MEIESYAKFISRTVQQLLSNPQLLRDFLDREIDASLRLVDQVLTRNAKKQPKSVKPKSAKREACAGA